MNPASVTPGTSATATGVEPRCAVSVGMPSPSTTVFGRLTAMVRLTSYTPGVRIRFRPDCSCPKIFPSLSPGLAR